MPDSSFVWVYYEQRRHRTGTSCSHTSNIIIALNFFTCLRKNANLHSQVEIVSIELLNPEETQIWKGENESVSSCQDLFLFLFIYAPYCRLYLTSKDWMLR